MNFGKFFQNLLFLYIVVLMNPLIEWVQSHDQWTLRNRLRQKPLISLSTINQQVFLEVFDHNQYITYDSLPWKVPKSTVRTTRPFISSQNCHMIWLISKAGMLERGKLRRQNCGRSLVRLSIATHESSGKLSNIGTMNLDGLSNWFSHGGALHQEADQSEDVNLKIRLETAIPMTNKHH